MTNGFFSKFLSLGKNIISTDDSMLGSTEYPWLSKNSKYGQGFRLSRTYVDDGFGYGSMPDIFSQMELEPAVIQAVREKYSWLLILDECIAEFGSAQKNTIEEFADCTGFADVCWWISVDDPAKWLGDMQKTIQRLYDASKQ